MTRQDWRTVFAVALIIAGFVVAVSTALDATSLRVVVGGLAAATGVALLL